jgi:AcrR family transcriptional regulator
MATTRSLARPQQKRSAKTRAAIAAAAAELFAHQGFAKTGVRDIADQAGVNQALVFYHFGNKGALYDEILAEGVAHAGALAAAANIESAPFPERELVRVFARALSSRPYLAPMILREQLDLDHLLDPASASKLRGMMALTERVLNAIPLREQASRYDPQIVHLICVGPLLHFLIATPFREATAAKLDSPVSTPKLEEFVETLGEFLSHALRDPD